MARTIGLGGSDHGQVWCTGSAGQVGKMVAWVGRMIAGCRHGWDSLTQVLAGLGQVDGKLLELAW